MKQNGITCGVITDLMPLYKEGLCCEDSRVLVEEHLAGCEDCRRLMGDIEIPELSAAVPDEAEAFKKIGRRMKKTRFMKAMSAVFCLLLVCFIIWNGVWLFVRYLPYRQLAKGMKRDSLGKGTGYSYSDGKYDYYVKMPGYLSFEGGFLRVNPIGGYGIKTDEEGALTSSDGNTLSLFIWTKGTESKETEYGALIDVFISDDESEMYMLYVDTSLNYIPHEQDTDTDISRSQELIDENRAELEGLMSAAQKQWGDSL